MAAMSMSCQSSLPAAHGWCTCTMVGVQPLQRSLPLLPPPPLRPRGLPPAAPAANSRPPARGVDCSELRARASRSSKGRVMVGGRAANPQARSKCTDTSSKPCARCEQSMPPSQPRTKNKGALLSALLERARSSPTCAGSARRHPSRGGPAARGAGSVGRRSSQGKAPKPRPLSVTRRV